MSVGSPRLEIADGLLPVDTWNPRAIGVEEDFSYIDLSAVDQEKKIIRESKQVSTKNAPSRARQIVAAGDILVSTVRPNLNAVAIVPADLDGATASTGFCVLRPRQDVLDSGYLFYWVRNPVFIRNMVSLATGANYPAVSDRIVKGSLMPFPDVREQKRIAAILDKADAIRRKRQQAIELADQFLRSVFLNMFGDPVANPKQWGVLKLGEVTSKIGSGATPRGGKSAYVDEGVSLIRSMNVHDDRFVHDDLAFITDHQADALSNVVVENDDVLLNITGASVCRCAMVDNDVLPARVNQHVCIIRPQRERVLPGYLLHLIISAPFKHQLLTMAGGAGATREALTKQQVENLLIPVPPVELQDQFQSITQRVKQIVASHKVQVAKPLFESLSQKAFAGEL